MRTVQLDDTMRVYHGMMTPIDYSEGRRFTVGAFVATVSVHNALEVRWHRVTSQPFLHWSIPASQLRQKWRVRP